MHCLWSCGRLMPLTPLIDFWRNAAHHGMSVAVRCLSLDVFGIDPADRPAPEPEPDHGMLAVEPWDGIWPCDDPKCGYCYGLWPSPREDAIDMNAKW